LEDDEKAQNFLEEALQKSTRSTRLREALVDLHVNCGRPTEALQHAMLLPAQLAKPETLEMVVRGACLAAQGNWTQAVCPLKDAYSAGCRDPLCLRWLTASFISSGELFQAQEVIQEWTRLAPDTLEVLGYQDRLKQLQQQTDGVVESISLQAPGSARGEQQVETSPGSIPTPS
jgi:predicted Zn-dependent protease